MNYFPEFYPCCNDVYRQPKTTQTQNNYPSQIPFTTGNISNLYPSDLINPNMPTGLPTGPTVAPPPMPSVPLISPAQLTPTLPVTQAMEADLSTQTVMSAQYTQGYLKSKIGSRVKVEFLIGTNMLVDREGTLVEVGTSYIVIREVDTDDLLLCDMYSIKFVRFYY